MRILFFIGVISTLLVGCIGEDKSYPELSIPTELSVIEPETGDIEFSIPMTLERNGDDSDFNLTVDLNHLSTSGDDVQLITSSEIVLDKVSPISSIKLLIRSDSLKEDTERFSVSVSSKDITIVGSTTIIELQDSTANTVIGFQNDTHTISEGVGEQNVAITITNPPEKDDILLTFDFSGTATISKDGISGDYTVVANQITVPAGSELVNLPITVLSDDKPEGGESIVITMSAPGREVSLNSTTVYIPGDLTINDTGVVEFFNGTGFQNSASTDYPKQDAEYGLDVGSSDVDGHAGFRLTRLDFAGNAVSSGSSFRCIKDENTGLIFEVKKESAVIPTKAPTVSYFEFIEEKVRRSKLETDDPEYEPYPYHEIHDSWQSSSFSFYWWNEDSSSNGGHQGTKGAVGFEDYIMLETCAFPNEKQVGFNPEITYCSSDDYVRYMNSVAVCGIKEWRLPTINELRSIINYNPSNDALSSAYFPNMNGYKYMSSTPYSKEKGSLWCMDTDTKQAKLCNKQSPNSIMLVRGTE